jgi:hypothetical protein
MGRFKFGQRVDVQLEAARAACSRIHLGGMFDVKLVRDGKIISSQNFRNDIVNEGLAFNLNTHFDGLTNVDPWHIGLITGSTPTLADTDTLVSNGWTEYEDYTGNRGIWTNGTASATPPVDMTNAVTVDFPIIAPGGTVGAVFIAEIVTKGTTTGTLWATALFAAAQTVGAGDVLKVTYTLTAAHA